MNRILETGSTNYRGLANELLICGNLAHRYKHIKVLADNNPNWDIQADGNFIECKLDAYPSTNFYFEVANTYYKRYTGILNSDMNTLYAHTFKRADNWYFLFGERWRFRDALKMCS